VILRDVLEAQGRSQTWLAAEVGISQSQMSKHLRGERTLNLDQLDAICHALGLHLHDVVQAADLARR
jgi:DNA-binding Xre family transcriptional regulator